MKIEIRSRDAVQLSKEEKDAFIRIVTHGGAVKEKYVRSGIERYGSNSLLFCINDEFVGVGAIKIPTSSYRDGLGGEAKSGYKLGESCFPYEIGYISVVPEWRGKKLSDIIVKSLLVLAGEAGLFATTSNPLMLCSILPKAGFKWVGKTWLGGVEGDAEPRPDLHLMVRTAKA